jgi:holin-like protein
MPRGVANSTTGQHSVRAAEPIFKPARWAPLVSRETVRARLHARLVGATGLITIGAQVALLSTICVVSTLIVTHLRLPVPGNVVGLLFLFALLGRGVVKERWVAGAADILTKHLAFFFVPIAVGLMDWGGLLWQAGHWLLLAIVVSSAVGMAVTGAVVQVCGPCTSLETH